jgi:protein gp37
MGDKTGISWTDATWNPVTGCDRTSPGCDHCYALTMAARLKRMGNPRYQNDGPARTSGPGFGVTVHQDALDLPIRWKRPRRIFVNSMSDLFHPAVPEDFIWETFEVMRQAPQHQFQVLTKRPQRMAKVVAAYCGYEPPLPNVWLGTSIESMRYEFRARWLLDTPAAVRFVSAEPLLGPLDLREYLMDDHRLDWVIVGGESGAEHRPMDLDWARAIQRDCAAAGVAFYFKQIASRRSGQPGPVDLNVHQLPDMRAA